MSRSSTALFFFILPLVFTTAGHTTDKNPDNNAAILSRLNDIEQRLSSRGLLEMLQQLESLQEEISRLHGELEVQNHTMKQLKKRQRDLYADIDQRMQRLENGTPAMTQPVDTASETRNPPLQTLSAINDAARGRQNSAADPALTVEVVAQQQIESGSDVMTATIKETAPASETNNDDISTAQVESDPTQARADYQQAFKLLNDSLYDQAIKAFHEFLLIHPNSEYSDNAQFWLGEVYMFNGDHEQALLEFNKVIQNYPASQKLNQAKLKIAYGYHELGQIDLARKQLEELIALNPGTTVARLAQKRLKDIAAASAEAASANHESAE